MGQYPFYINVIIKSHLFICQQKFSKKIKVFFNLFIDILPSYAIILRISDIFYMNVIEAIGYTDEF